MEDFLAAAPKRQISEAHKEKLRENMARARVARKSNAAARRVALARELIVSEGTPGDLPVRLTAAVDELVVALNCLLHAAQAVRSYAEAVRDLGVEASA